MKTFLSIIGLVVVVALLFFVFGSTADAPTEEETASSSDDVSALELTSVEAGTYSVSASSSEVRWQARKPLIESYVDTGFVPVSSGEVVVGESGIADASVSFNIAGIEVRTVSNQNAGADRLTGHLRSEDFFAAREFPTGEFVLTSADEIASTTAATDHTLTGDLTLKGETQEISFPAIVGMNEAGELALSASTVIDRSRWNIRYGSDSFFDDLGDNLIADEVQIEIDLVATPAS